jgi:hypothetical protein
MMEYTAYKCDVCGRPKGEANHWFRAARVPGPRWVIIPWELSMRDEQAPVEHLCGLECAVKSMMRAMNES